MTTYAHETLAKLLDYDPITGYFLWKPRTPDLFDAVHPVRACAAWNASHAGQRAFTTEGHGGYLTTTIFGRRVMAHRAAWCLGQQADIGPGLLIDHINGNPKDNRLSNLRLSTATQNMQNASKRKAGLRGAVFHKGSGKWQASIRLHLGTFDTEAEAAAAYEAAAERLHGEFYLPNGKRATARRIL
jgi:hypothetical protein